MKNILINLLFVIVIVPNLEAGDNWTVQDANDFGNGAILHGELSLNSVTVSEDWGERLVDPNYYIQKGGSYAYSPYISPNGEIKLINEGTSGITLKSPQITSNIHGEGFKYKDGTGNYISFTDSGVLDFIFNNKVISPGVPLIINVYFDPKINGNHELIVKFPNDDKDTSTFILSGIGVFPKTSTSDVDFGNVEIGSVAVEKTVNFNNLIWENDYPLTITGFEFKETVGQGNFKFKSNKIYDKKGSLLFLPFTLEPGNYITVSCEFKPLEEGTFTATLTTVSNAEIEAVSNWTGGGITTGITEDEKFGNSLIYPNPANDFIDLNINIGASPNATGKVQIFNIFGLEVGQLSLIDGNNRIDIFDLQPGVYFIRIGDRVLKFVKL